MAQRRKRDEEHDNHERWMVSYADFITLLFAFFVVMYALSSVNEGKYRVLSESMATAFRRVQAESTEKIPVLMTPPIGVVPRPMPVAKPREIPKPEAAKPDETQKQEAQKQERRDRMRSVAKDILEVMAPLIEQGKVRVIETSRGVSVEVNDSILFSPGQAVLQQLSIKAMRAIAQVLAPTDFPITIEGHTDNVPINTPQFPSNWELSAVRATTVLRLFVDEGVAPDRLTAIGYADTRPVEPNLLADGRARNRRVTILIDSDPSERGREVAIDGSSPKAGQ